MKSRDARRLTICCIVLALTSTWWLAISSLQEDHIPTELDRKILGTANIHEKSLDQTTTGPNNNITKKVATSKPYFILHVGPPKTGTTTIQCGLEHRSAELAKEDSYYYIGKRCGNGNKTMGNGEEGLSGHHLIMGLNNVNPNSRGIEKLKKRMAFHLSQQSGSGHKNHHMIYSLEAMSNHLENRTETWDLFLSLFEGWNVQIVVSYRYYFDWIRSMYFQQHIGKKYTDEWPPHPQQIQPQKGKVIPSFQAYLQYHLQRWEEGTPSNDGYSFGQHLSLYALEYFSEHFSNVRVFDLHKREESFAHDKILAPSDDLLTRFVCEMLPHADAMCQRLVNEQRQLQQTQSSKTTTTTSNQKLRESHSFDADRLAVAAYEEGLINPNLSRKVVVGQISQHLQETNLLAADPSFVSCIPSDMQAMLLNASLWFEDKVFQRIKQVTREEQPISLSHFESVANRTESTTNTSLSTQFSVAVNSGKFCEVNVSRVLQLEDWRQFLNGLKPKGRKRKMPPKNS